VGRAGWPRSRGSGSRSTAQTMSFTLSGGPPKMDQALIPACSGRGREKAGHGWSWQWRSQGVGATAPIRGHANQARVRWPGWTRAHSREAASFMHQQGVLQSGCRACDTSVRWRGLHWLGLSDDCDAHRNGQPTPVVPMGCPCAHAPTSEKVAKCNCCVLPRSV
jgi:hypothetical protein